jgi:DNA polymerase-3 subunit delta'
MDTWQTFGHEKVKNILSKQMGNGVLPHAYLFSGPEGVGKKTLAEEFAKKLLQAQKLENHPDFQLLDMGTSEITVEGALSFIAKLAFKPFMAGKKVAIINNAENLNTQSSNALLKTLEEPAENSIIILIASAAKLLPTIISRCQVLYFNSFPAASLKEFAKTKNLGYSKDLADLSFGRLSRLLKLADDPEFLRSEKQAVAKYQELCKSGLGEKIAAINSYADLDSEDLLQNFTLWLNWQANKLTLDIKNYGKLQALTDSIQGLKLNKNKKLVLQSLFLKI